VAAVRDVIHQLHFIEAGDAIVDLMAILQDVATAIVALASSIALLTDR